MVQDCIICAIQDTGGLDFPFKDVRMENGPKRLSDVDVSILESFNYVKEVHIQSTELQQDKQLNEETAARVEQATSEFSRFSDLGAKLRRENEAKGEVALIGVKDQLPWW